MLSHQLILDAAEQAIRTCQPLDFMFLQRRLRVGYATATQLVDALTEVGVVAPRPDGRHHRVLTDTFDREATLAATHRAVAEGRLELHDAPCAECPTERKGRPVRYAVGEWGVYFGTRAHAAEIRLDVGRRTTSAVLLDFTGVQAMTGAFADELVAELAAGRPVEVTGANEYVAETIRFAAARRSVEVTIRG